MLLEASSSLREVLFMGCMLLQTHVCQEKRSKNVYIRIIYYIYIYIYIYFLWSVVISRMCDVYDLLQRLAMFFLFIVGIVSEC